MLSFWTSNSVILNEVKNLFLIDLHLKLRISPLNLREGFFYALVSCEKHTYTAMSHDFRLSENPDLDTRFRKDFLKIAEFIFLCRTLDNDGL